MATINIKDITQDIVKNVVSTGFFDKIKITAGKKAATIEALEGNKQVILKGATLNPVDGWDGEFGWGGHCFIKDNYELEQFSDSPLVKYIRELNDIHRAGVGF